MCVLVVVTNRRSRGTRNPVNGCVRQDRIVVNGTDLFSEARKQLARPSQPASRRVAQCEGQCLRPMGLDHVIPGPLAHVRLGPLQPDLLGLGERRLFLVAERTQRNESHGCRVAMHSGDRLGAWPAPSGPIMPPTSPPPPPTRSYPTPA